jgi:hypothetical protein
MNRRRYLALVSSASLLCAVAWAESCEVRMTRPSNAYFADETVQMTLSLPAPRREVSAVVTDYCGVVRSTGSVSVGGEQPVALAITPALGCGHQARDLLCAAPPV